MESFILMDIERADSAFPTLLHYYYALTRALHRGTEPPSPTNDAQSAPTRRRRPGLPKELVYMILRHAELLSPRTSTRLSFSWSFPSSSDPAASRRRYRGRYQFDDAYGDESCEAVVATNSAVTAKLLFATAPLNRATIGKMGNVMLMTESKDQGRYMHETGSWSWFEIGIIRAGDQHQEAQPDVGMALETDESARGAMQAKLDAGTRQPLRWVSHNNPISSKRFDRCVGEEFKPGHPMYRLLEPGDRIGVWMCARHHGWACKARSASVVVWEWFEPRWV